MEQIAIFRLKNKIYYVYINLKYAYVDRYYPASTTYFCHSQMESRAIHGIDKVSKIERTRANSIKCMRMIEIRMNLEIFALTRVLSDFFLKWAGMWWEKNTSNFKCALCMSTTTHTHLEEYVRICVKNVFFLFTNTHIPFCRVLNRKQINPFIFTTIDFRIKCVVSF